MKKLIATLQQKWLMWKIEREIYGQIAPHVRGKQNTRYQFDSIAELKQAADRMNQNSLAHLKYIEAQAHGMGKAYGDGFRYIMYRDINRRLAGYQKILEQQVLPATCDPRFIATRA